MRRCLDSQHTGVWSGLCVLPSAGRVVDRKGRQEPSAHRISQPCERATLQEALQVLKAERIQQGLSLADIQQRSGIEKPNLSRLENETANPTVATLIRYAEALGKRLMIVLADRTSAKPSRQR